jgi:hypothetical protein
MAAPIDAEKFRAPLEMGMARISFMRKKRADAERRCAGARALLKP